MRPYTASWALPLLALLAGPSVQGAAGQIPTPAADPATASVGGDLVLADVRVVDVRAGAEVIDARGRYLIPGLLDAHAHVRHPAAPDVVLPQFVAHGITGIRDMNSDCDGLEDGDVCIERMKESRAAVDAGEMVGPRLLALSSFPLDPPWNHEVTEEQVRGMLDELDSRGLDLIKTYNRLSPDAFRWFVEGALERGMDAAGHVPLRVTVAAASEAGLRSVEHARALLFDCFPDADELRRTPRSVDAELDDMAAMVEDHDPEICAETFRTLVRNGIWYVPTHLTRRMEARADDPALRNDPRLRYVWGEVRAQWHADADRVVERSSSEEDRAIMEAFYRKGLEISDRAHKAGVPIAVGTDAGDSFVFWGSSVHDEMVLLRENPLVAIVGELLGGGLPWPVLMAMGGGSHLASGGVAGGLLAVLTRAVTVMKGLGRGVLLWGIMGLTWLPIPGWGVFGTGISPRVAVATLVLHGIYGATLGWLVDRQ